MRSLRSAALALLLTVPLSLPAVAQTDAAQRQADITFWTSIKNSKNPSEYKAYLEAFPKGLFAPLAKLRMKQLAAGGDDKTPAPATTTAKPSSPAPASPAPASQAPASPPPATTAKPAPPPPKPADAPRTAGPPEPESGPPPAGSAPAQPPRVTRPADPPAAPPPAASSPPPPRTASSIDYTDRAFMRALQEKLYVLNYLRGEPTGRFNKDTYNAVVRLQRRLGQTPNGELTGSQWRRAQGLKAGTIWGAIAYNANATHAFAFERQTRRDAEEAAVNACRRRAGRRAKCTVMAAMDNQCIAMAKYSQRWGSQRYFGVSVYQAGDLQRAQDRAMERCERNPRSRGRCRISRFFCANGSHR